MVLICETERWVAIYVKFRLASVVRFPLHSSSLVRFSVDHGAQAVVPGRHPDSTASTSGDGRYSESLRVALSRPPPRDHWVAREFHAAATSLPTRPVWAPIRNLAEGGLPAYFVDDGPHALLDQVENPRVLRLRPPVWVA